MPRNSSGVYVLPNAAFVPNTVISSAAVNSDLSDIANALTDSVAASGVTSMTGQLKAASGSVGNPSLSFASDTATGIYLSGSHQIGFATNGIQAVTINSDQSVTLQNINFNGTTYTFGAGAASGFWQGIAANSAIEFFVDGSGSVITTGIKGWVEIPYNCTIKRATLLADQVGSITIDVLTSTFAAYNPGGSFASITGGSPPAIVGALASQNSTLAGWTTALTAGTIMEFNVPGAVTNIQKCTISLVIQRTAS